MLSNRLSVLANSFAGAGHLVLLGFAWFSEDERVWAGALWVVALISVVSWIATHRRARLIRDTPTSRIGSAHQGYVELVGAADLHEGEVVAGPQWAPVCVWYRYTIRCEERTAGGTNRRTTTTTRCSDETFILRDDSGVCVIDPEGAEVVTTRRSTRRDGDCTYELEYFKPGDTLYALGEFTTVRRGDGVLDPNEDTRELLREWKNKPGEMARFDANGDGKIDMEEWEEARKAARAEVEAQHMEHRLHPGVHMLRAPSHGRIFLLSNIDPDKLAQRFTYWSWFHLAVFIPSAVAAPILTGRLALF